MRQMLLIFVLLFCVMENVDGMDQGEKFPSQLKRIKRYRSRQRRFNESEVTWRIDRFSNSSGLTNADLTHAIKGAFDAWSDVIPLDFRQITNKEEPVDISVRFCGDGYDESCGKIDWQGNYLLARTQHTKKPIEVYFSGEKQWVVGNASEQFFDLHTLAMHEIGHALGLRGHSIYGDSLMSGRYSGRHAVLTSDVIQDIQALYGVRVTQNMSLGNAHENGEKYTTTRAPPLEHDGYSETTFKTEVASPSERTLGIQIGLGVSIPIITVLLTSSLTFYFRRKQALCFHRQEEHLPLTASPFHEWIDASDLRLIRRIGQGEFGEVWLANYSLPNRLTDRQKHVGKVKVALKMRKSSKSAQSTLTSADCFFHESVALNFLHHTNIITAFGLCTNFRPYPPILVLEYMNGGNCIDYVKSERSRLTNIDLAKICHDLIKACVHMSNMHVIHKDIAARNVLIRKNQCTGKPIIAKLTDFGLARDVGKLNSLYKSTNKDAVFHLHSTAPEGFGGKFSSQSDVWSFGIFVWEIHTLLDFDEAAPYAHLDPPTTKNLLDFLKSGSTPNSPPSAPSDVCEMMRQCWALEPSKRPTFKQLDAVMKNIRKLEIHSDSEYCEEAVTSTSFLVVSSEDFEEEAGPIERSSDMMSSDQRKPEIVHISTNEQTQGYKNIEPVSIHEKNLYL